MLKKMKRKFFWNLFGGLTKSVPSGILESIFLLRHRFAMSFDATFNKIHHD